MTIEELKSKLITAGISPILIEPRETSNSIESFVFSGDLVQFINTVKSLKSDVVLVWKFTLDEDDFFYDPSDEDLDENEIEEYSDLFLDENSDLRKINPELNKYNKFINLDCCYCLIAPTHFGHLYFKLSEAWWGEFSEVRLESISKLEDLIADRTNSHQTELDSKRKALLQKLKDLISDPVFVKLTTQRGMLAYAKNKFPELDGIGERVLQGEIWHLSDTIKARKLGAKN